jgi:hypothetical protein
MNMRLVAQVQSSSHRDRSGKTGISVERALRVSKRPKIQIQHKNTQKKKPRTT